MNKLHNQVSPYLLQHKNNPVHWQPWSEEALSQAKRENKPIIVSIGYAACHWCHVMEKESFEDEQVAALMNEYFINIKVDREERPDVDQIYMEAIHHMGLSGGWPLNVFLMPDQKPFYGGTYFPKAKWIQLLNSIHEAFKNHETELQKSADGFQKSLNEQFLQATEIHYFNSEEFQKHLIHKILSSIDPYFGGINKAPKFPMPTLWSFLEEAVSLQIETPRVSNSLDLTLKKMAQGGIFDHVDGGFSRYSVDSEWFCPHFEKMLYDNGQLLSLYSKAFKRTANPIYKEVVYKTIQFHQSNFKQQNNLYSASMDADSEGEEGKFYVWTFDELNELLPAEENKEFYHDFSISLAGNWESGQNILFKKSDFASEKYANQLNLLADRRAKRMAPAIDDKQLLSWNAMYLLGLIDAYESFHDHQLLIEIDSIFLAIEQYFYQNSQWLHQTNYASEPIPAFLDDLAFLSLAYIKYYFIRNEHDLLQKSELLMNHIIEDFYDSSKGVFCYSNLKKSGLIANIPELIDSVIPSSNSVTVEALLYLGTLLDKADYSIIGNRVLENVLSKASENPSYFSNWWRIMLTFYWKPKIIIKSNLPKEAIKSILDPIPELTNQWIFIDAKSSNSNQIMVCRGTVCFAPIQELNDLASFLRCII